MSGDMDLDAVGGGGGGGGEEGGVGTPMFSSLP